MRARSAAAAQPLYRRATGRAVSARPLFLLALLAVAVAAVTLTLAPRDEMLPHRRGGASDDPRDKAKHADGALANNDAARIPQQLLHIDRRPREVRRSEHDEESTRVRRREEHQAIAIHEAEDAGADNDDANRSPKRGVAREEKRADAEVHARHDQHRPERAADDEEAEAHDHRCSDAYDGAARDGRKSGEATVAKVGLDDEAKERSAEEAAEEQQRAAHRSRTRQRDS